MFETSDCGSRHITSSLLERSEALELGGVGRTPMLLKASGGGDDGCEISSLLDLPRWTTVDGAERLVFQGPVI